MKRLIPFIVFVSLNCFATSSSLPVLAGGCSSNIKEKAETKCAKDDTDCQTEKAEKFELNKTIRS